MPINTARVRGRRKLDYGSYEELLADAERLSASPATVLGNWSLGQILKHLAIVYQCSIDGFPARFPWLFRTAARLVRGIILKAPMPAGFALKPDAASVMAPGPTSTQDGLADLRAAIARLARESHRVMHPIFGRLTEAEWTQLNLKHASLHMSFVLPHASSALG